MGQTGARGGLRDANGGPLSVRDNEPSELPFPEVRRDTFATAGFRVSARGCRTELGGYPHTEPSLT
jgi:hypothetical protein